MDLLFHNMDNTCYLIYIVNLNIFLAAKKQVIFLIIEHVFRLHFGIYIEMVK